MWQVGSTIYMGVQRKAKAFLKNKVEKLTLSDIKTYHTAIVLKSVSKEVWQIGQWNRIKNSKIDLYLFENLMYDR